MEISIETSNRKFNINVLYVTNKYIAEKYSFNEHFQTIDIVLVSCGKKNRIAEVEVFMKSAILLQSLLNPSININFIVFTDNLQYEVLNLVEKWKIVPGIVNYSIEIR